jgi:FlaA1/EpsC-like NDP-sugar epimerase
MRYFMTIPEACQLILQASAIGQGGEIFVLDMGKAINIAYLADQMIRLSGRNPGTDISIVYTGLRPGEKLQEELFHADEDLAPTSHGKLLLAGHMHTDSARIARLYEDLCRACEVFDEDGIRRQLTQAIPELLQDRGQRRDEMSAGANVLELFRSK